MNKVFIFLFFSSTFIGNAQQVQILEYFFNVDPGFGNGEKIEISDPSTKNIILNADISDAPLGWNSLYFRFKDNLNQWSLTHGERFYKTAKLDSIIEAEYFIDTDPGFGQGTPVSISKTKNLLIPISINQLSTGLHSLIIRVKDESGIWSLTKKEKFWVETISNDITGLEYFFDEDPGFGQAKQIAFNFQNNNNMVFTVDMSDLQLGWHQLFVRFRDNTGTWSLLTKQLFMKEKKAEYITKLEYFFDEDPGIGSGIEVTNLPQDENMDIDIEISLANLNYGDHLLFVRALDDNGNWSYTNIQSFSYDIINGMDTFKPQSSLELYPNPVENNLKVRLQNPDEHDVFILDMKGQEIAKYKVTGEINLDFSHFTSGVYFIKSITEEQITIERVVKQ